MYRSAMGFVKGLGFGVLACVAAVAIGSTMDHLMDNVGHMLR